MFASLNDKKLIIFICFFFLWRCIIDIFCRNGKTMRFPKTHILLYHFISYHILPEPGYYFISGAISYKIENIFSFSGGVAKK